MKRLLLALLLLLAACCPTPPTQFAQEASAVRPLADSDGGIYCTAWHLTAGRWVTARHCALALRMLELTGHGPSNVDGKKVSVLALSKTADVALLLRSEPGSFPGLRLGRAPSFGVPVHYIGYPRTEATHHGVYSGYVGDTYGGSPAGVVFELSVFADGGASGSPVLDEEGNVVGIVSMSYRGRPYSYAVPVSALRQLLDVVDAQ